MALITQNKYHKHFDIQAHFDWSQSLPKHILPSYLSHSHSHMYAFPVYSKGTKFVDIIKMETFPFHFLLDSSWGYFLVAAFSMSILKVWDSSWRLHFL